MASEGKSNDLTANGFVCLFFFVVFFFFFFYPLPLLSFQNPKRRLLQIQSNWTPRAFTPPHAYCPPQGQRCPSGRGSGRGRSHSHRLWLHFLPTSETPTETISLFSVTLTPFFFFIISFPYVHPLFSFLCPYNPVFYNQTFSPDSVILGQAHLFVAFRTTN